jgi:acetyl-CoA carboxylase carboxyltransferase component
VRLGYRKELEAAADDAARELLFREMVDRMYEHGKAVSVASFFEIDDVIDPADTRRWITTIFDAAPETHRSAVDPVGAVEASQRRHLVRVRRRGRRRSRC